MITENRKEILKTLTKSKTKMLLVLYTRDDWDIEDLKLSAGIQRSFEVWRDILEKKGIQLGRASIRWFEAKHFNRYWSMRADGTWEKIEQNVWPTYLYDKTRTYNPKNGQSIPEILAIKQNISEKIRMLNTLEFTNLIENKLNQAVVFSEFMPSTRLLLPGYQIKNPDKQNVVLKRLYGSGGRQVKISDAKTISVREMLVRQQFVKATKEGKLRDIRVGFIGDEPQYAYYRIAKKGDLFTNVHQGATMRFEKLSNIKSLLEFSARVAEPLKVFRKKIFSLDYLIDAKTGQPFLIEANSMPGFENFPDDALEKFFTSLTKLFLSN